MPRSGCSALHGVNTNKKKTKTKKNKGISNFRIPHQSFINENCSNSRTSHDIEIELVTKLDEKNKATSKKFGDDVMPTNCDVFFLNYGQFAAVQGRFWMYGL